MQIGDYRIETIPDTEFRLDGGAMFGVVPRVLWEKVSPPDELNRVRLNMNCLFVERRLSDFGRNRIGEKWSEKHRDVRNFSRKTVGGNFIRANRLLARDISHRRQSTHLHFDHAGGNNDLGFGIAECGFFKPQSEIPIPIHCFPISQRALFVSASEFEHAENPHERDRASYLSEIALLKKADSSN